MKIARYALITVLGLAAAWFGTAAAAGLVRGKDMGAQTKLLAHDEETGVFELQMKPGGPLRLAVFTDLHLDGLDPLGMLQTTHWLRKNVKALRPDMIAVLGDTVLCPLNHLRTRCFVKLMDSFGLPWTAVLGNHEGEAALDLQRRDVLRYYKESGLFLGEVGLPGVTGYGNQAVAVRNDAGECAQLLYFLDSGGGKKGHSYIQPDQLSWLGRAGAPYAGAPGMIFMHIPAYQYRAAYEALQSGQAQLLRGGLREGVCTEGTPEQSEALVARAKELGVWAFVCGHDHANDFDISYQGMRYIYAQSGGYSRACYDGRSRGVRGCTVFVILPDGSVESEQNFN